MSRTYEEAQEARAEELQEWRERVFEPAPAPQIGPMPSPSPHEQALINLCFVVHRMQKLLADLDDYTDQPMPILDRTLWTVRQLDLGQLIGFAADLDRARVNQ